MKETLIDLKTRRSCRKFLPKQIAQNDLEAILEAGTYAPSGMNHQSPVILVIQDKATIEKLAALNAMIMGKTTDFDPFYGAPTLLLVLADRQYRTWHEDGNLVMGNLLNAAHAVGIDSCYIYRAKEEFEREEGKALLKKWGIIGDYVGIGHCALGYAAEGGVKAASPRKENYVIYV